MANMKTKMNECREPHRVHFLMSGIYRRCGTTNTKSGPLHPVPLSRSGCLAG